MVTQILSKFVWTLFVLVTCCHVVAGTVDGPVVNITIVEISNTNASIVVQLLHPNIYLHSVNFTLENNNGANHHEQQCDKSYDMDPLCTLYIKELLPGEVYELVVTDAIYIDESGDEYEYIATFENDAQQNQIKFCTVPETPSNDIDWLERGYLSGNRLELVREDVELFDIMFTPVESQQCYENRTFNPDAFLPRIDFENGCEYEARYAKKCIVPETSSVTLSEWVQYPSSFCSIPDAPNVVGVIERGESFLTIGNFTASSGYANSFALIVYADTCLSDPNFYQQFFTMSNSFVNVTGLEAGCAYMFQYSATCTSSSGDVKESTVKLSSQSYCTIPTIRKNQQKNRFAELSNEAIFSYEIDTDPTYYTFTDFLYNAVAVSYEVMSDDCAVDEQYRMGYLDGLSGSGGDGSSYIPMHPDCAFNVTLRGQCNNYETDPITILACTSIGYGSSIRQIDKSPDSIVLSFSSNSKFELFIVPEDEYNSFDFEHEMGIIQEATDGAGSYLSIGAGKYKCVMVPYGYDKCSEPRKRLLNEMIVIDCDTEEESWWSKMITCLKNLTKRVFSWFNGRT